MAKSAIFFVTNFLPINQFALTFFWRKLKGSFEKPLLETTLHHVLRHAYLLKQSLGKIPNKNYPKIKACEIVEVVGKGKFWKKFWLD